MIDRSIDEAVATLRPIDGGDRLGFQVDLFEALKRSGAIVDPEIVVSADPRCIFDARGTVAPQVQNIHELSPALDRVFSMIQYRYFRASSVVWLREAVVLRFLTIIDAKSYFVTGQISVSGGPYAELVTKYDRKFGPLHGPLPSGSSEPGT